jgi:hypothetical protein
MKLAGQGDGRDRARIFVITCRLVGRRPWFSGKGHRSRNLRNDQRRGQLRADLVVLTLTQNA